MRTCCLLTAPLRPLFPDWIDASDPTELAHSTKGRDRVGIVYTVRGGFIDFGHLRDVADLTRYYHEALSLPGRVFPPGSVPGTCLVKAPPADADERLAIARSMAYAESVFHEVESYWQGFPGMHNSSFSPEDLVWNWLGTYVAEHALRDTGHEYGTAVAIALGAVLTRLGAVTPAESQYAFEQIDGRWVVRPTISPTYLQRRNFTGDRWLVAGMTTADTSWPDEITREDWQRDAYEITFDIRPREDRGKDERRRYLGTKVLAGELSQRTLDVRAMARTTYGPDADKP